MYLIPEGRKIRIFKGGKPLTGLNGVPLILEDDFSFNLSSSFEQLWSGNEKLSKLRNVISAASKDLGADFLQAATGVSKAQGYQIWSSTDPITFNLNLKFEMGSAKLYDARKEVYEPMITLASLSLPTLDPVLNNILVPPGPSIVAVASTYFENADIPKDSLMSIEVGNMLRLNSVIVTKAEPTFSPHLDENDYPIKGVISLEIRTVDIAHVELLTNYRRTQQ